MRYMLFLLGLLMLACGADLPKAFAKDSGQYADVPQATRDWVSQLRPVGNGKFLRSRCCDLSDGQILDDTQWDYGKDAYKVFLTTPEDRTFPDGTHGKWFDVPPESLVTGENKVGHALVWVRWTYDSIGSVTLEVNIDCFLPGGGV